MSQQNDWHTAHKIFTRFFLKEKLYDYFENSFKFLLKFVFKGPVYH